MKVHSLLKCFARNPITAVVLIVISGCATPTPLQRSAAKTEVSPRHVAGSQAIAFHRVIIHVQPSAPIGHHYGGLLRITHATYYWRSGIAIGSEEFKLAATEELRNSGFDVLGEENLVFGEDNGAKARFQLGGTIKQIGLNTYDPFAGGFSESTVEVEWQLQDSFTKKIVLTETTSGYFKQDGTSIGIVPLAFRNALVKLIAKSQLADLVAKNKATEVSATLYPESIKVANAKRPKSLSLPDDIEEVMQSVVLIKAGRTLASGFIISPNGYVLTAAHVVSGVKEVEVQLKSGLQLNATVVRADEAQDIGLIKIAGEGHRCLELNLGTTTPVGNELYAIGAPMSEKLAFTVTKGIVSGYRERENDKARFIQTDASLNPGNSGGPLLAQVRQS